ncbi:DUF1326 domain-containing protein [Chromohalobacter israelensis]|uniref:DUF1326 domain-containing protein n=1 Tax=Chromohalobacter israelensis TaxID=141390 RepID=UPI000FFEF58E|nr:DUF1326 domain-containing protein [Chromohalobacter salexigens]RXE47321.1 hypothetical protein B4O83_04665 [Chromohalobacter salexigens]
MNTQWKLEGDYLESCTCKGACPCLYLGAPTEGDCTALVGWHLSTGQYGDVELKDLNVAVALYAPGPMAEGDWKAVLYLDQRGDERQQEAMEMIFGGQAGGHPALLASLISEVRAVERIPIRYEAEKGQRHLTLGESAGARIKALVGQDGGDIYIRNHPLAVAPGESLVVATSQSLFHQAHGIDVDLSERTAFYSPFTYAGP